MSTLLLVHGPPGVEKSTVAAALVRDRPLALLLDVDRIRHDLGRWDEDLDAAGRQARRLALALAHRHLADGHDVVVPQFLVRPEFAEDLRAVAAKLGARFAEACLVLDAEPLAERLRERHETPDRPEHAALNALVGAADAPSLVERAAAFVGTRPGAALIDAGGSLDQVTDRLAPLLDAPLPGRVSLTPLVVEDAEAYVDGEDEEIVRWLSGGRSTVDRTRAFIRELDARSARGAAKRAFTIRLDGRVAGSIDHDAEVTDGLDPGDVNLAYGVHPWARGRGVAVRAVELICARLREQGAVAAVIRADLDNVASLRVAERAGFRPVREIVSEIDPDEEGRAARMRVLRRAL